MDNNIIRTIQELKGHALAGGTILPFYAEDIVDDALKDLSELKRLAEIGLAVENAIKNIEKGQE